MTHAIDQFDELAAMFLTAPQAKAPSMQAAAVGGGGTASALPVALRSTNGHYSQQIRRARESVIELLIVGNLPVRAGLWLTPYADAVGRQGGATALLRLDGDEPTLQLFRTVAAPGPQRDRPYLHETLCDLAAEVDHWIVRVPAGTSGAQCAALRPERITILTSGDEAAIVAAYQLIKELAASPHAGPGEEPQQPAVPSVGLAIVGVDQRSAMSAVERLNRTTVSFLGVEVRLAMCLQRMDPGIKSTGYLTFADQTCPTLADVTAWLNEARQAAAAQRDSAESSTAAEADGPSPIAGRLHADRTDSKVSDAAEILREDAHNPGAGAGGPEIVTTLLPGTTSPPPRPLPFPRPMPTPVDDPPMPVAAPAARVAPIRNDDELDEPPAIVPWPAAPRVARSDKAARRDFRPTPSQVTPPSRPVVIEKRCQEPFFASGIAGLPRAAPPPSAKSVARSPLPASPAARVAIAPAKSIKLAPKPALKPALDIECKRSPSTPSINGQAAADLGIETTASTAVANEPSDHGQPVALSTYVEGLISLPVRSPGHERVELAVDSVGRLHLLGRENSLREMRLVENWARAHRELIAMACPQQPIDPGAKVTCHIFSPEPVSLADLHGADLRLHVLAPVQVNGQTAWYAAPLNNART